MSERLANVIIALLSIAIFVVLILFYALPSYSYYMAQNHSTGTITVGQANFEFVNDLPLFSNLSNYVGGEINEPVTVINARDKQGQNTTNLVDCYLRFSLNTRNSLQPQVDANKFLKSSDNYYYYKGTFKVGQELTLINTFNLDDATDEEYLNGIDVEVTVDIMQATKSMVLDVFPNAPQEWINIL